MIPVRDNLRSKEPAIMTTTITVLLAFIYLWDRNWSLFGPSVAFADLAMRPREIIDLIKGTGDVSDLGKLFTSMFLHANLWHLVANLLFLTAFGPNVEAVLKAPRFALYFIFWALMAWAAQIWSSPASDVPVIGASGAIGGVLGCYFLLFPGNQIKFILFPLVFWRFNLSAWILLGFWFLTQILLPQEGVANWAHAGGFLAGMLTVLVMGGRDKVIREGEFEVDEDFDED